MQMMKVGFWAKGSTVIEISGDRHINYMWQFPEKFDLTIDQIKKVYKKHKEKRGAEGKAREELIVLASMSGWVRVRQYDHKWSIQCDVYERRKKTIRNFVEWAYLTKKIMKNTDWLVILSFETGSYYEKNASLYLKENKTQNHAMVYKTFKGEMMEKHSV